MLSIKRYDFDATNLYDNENNRDDVIAQQVYQSLKIMSGERCAICQRIYTDNNKMTIEHIVPRSMDQNLKNDHTNLLGICWDCNNKRDNTIKVICPTKIETLHTELYVGLSGEIRVKSDSCYKACLEKTIESYKLNRKDYKSMRQNFYKALENNSNMIDVIIDDILNNNLDNSLNLFPSMVIQKMEDNYKKDLIDRYYDRRIHE